MVDKNCQFVIYHIDLGVLLFYGVALLLNFVLADLLLVIDHIDLGVLHLECFPCDF